MRQIRVCLLTALLVTVFAGTALAQPVPPPLPDPNAPPPPSSTPPPEETKKKEPKAGDFDAGGQVRLPSGPDEMGQYATFNWVAFDAKGTYYLLAPLALRMTIPLAIVKPDSQGVGVEPSVFGGFSVTLDARLPRGPFASMMKLETDVALLLTGAYMKEGAMLLSEKDFPLYVGDLQPGFAGGLSIRVKLSSLLDFSLVPAWVYQSGEVESVGAVQMPLSLILALGDLIKVSADLGIYTGDDYSFSAEDGGRIYAGGALDVKIGSIIVHGGAGTASLITGGLYPSVKDAFYIDLNVKYAK